MALAAAPAAGGALAVTARVLRADGSEGAEALEVALTPPEHAGGAGEWGYAAWAAPGERVRFRFAAPGLLFYPPQARGKTFKGRGGWGGSSGEGFAWLSPFFHIFG